MVCVLTSSACAEESPSGAAAPPTTPEAKRGYALGYQWGTSVAQFTDLMDVSAVVAGLNDAIAKRANALGDAEMQSTMSELQQLAEQRQREEQERVMREATEEGRRFLETNGKRDGVTTLPSGLQYEVLKPGTGPKPVATDRVKTHYHGTLIDGRVFDSSVDRGSPASFAITGVIPGWTEALQLMAVGAKWRLYVPPQLAYGGNRAGPMIEPWSTLVFEVELLSIE